MLCIIAASLADIIIIVVVGSIWAHGISSTTWEEIDYLKRTGETE